MKTAISLPDATFARATKRSKELGMSRSEFFAQAADSYLDQLDAASITNQIDAVLELLGGMDESSEVAVAAGRSVLEESEQW